MESENNAPPTTLLDAVRYFADPDICLRFVAEMRWPEGATCPYCETRDPMFIRTRRIWKCRSCRKTFSAKRGTIFEDSPIPLDKWLTAMWMIANCKNGVSSWEIHRHLKVTQKTAWFLLHRIRLVMQTGSFRKLGGDVEVDETFIGGRARNMHLNRRRSKITGTGGSGKAVVMGILERDGEVKAMVVPTRRKQALHAVVKECVEEGANLYTDALKSYEGLDSEYVHKVIDHAEAYVQD